MDRIVFISQHGMDYYLKYFATDVSDRKYTLARMGVSAAARTPDNHSDRFYIVSCSSVIPLKRIELIIDGLSCIHDLQIDWTHIGDGTDLKHITAYADEKLGKLGNVSYHFPGSMQNLEIRKYYAVHSIDAFIITSETEGCPVAVQEALSAGIPVIATPVGELPLMVQKNGTLLSDNPTGEEVAAALQSLIREDDQRKAERKQNAFDLWNREYNREENNPRLIKILEEV